MCFIEKENKRLGKWAKKWVAIDLSVETATSVIRETLSSAGRFCVSGQVEKCGSFQVRVWIAITPFLPSTSVVQLHFPLVFSNYFYFIILNFFTVSTVWIHAALLYTLFCLFTIVSKKLRTFLSFRNAAVKFKETRNEPLKVIENIFQLLPSIRATKIGQRFYKKFTYNS